MLIKEVDKILNGKLNNTLQEYSVKVLEKMLTEIKDIPIEKFMTVSLIEGLLAHLELALALELKKRYNKIIRESN